MSQNKIMEPCQLCKTITSKYVCPKCNIQYCSIKCYRSPDHLACSEEFYRHCISEELGARGEDFNKSEINILEALKRFNEDENNEYEDIDSDEENEEVDDLEKRFAEIDVASTDKLWSLLNDEEKTEFQKLVASGKAIEMVPQWKPWWNFRSKSKVLESEEAFKDELKKNGCPEICTTKKLSEIIKKDPSPLVQFNVFNVLVGYCYIMLLFNGDLSDLSGEATMNLLKVSTNLNSSVNFNSAEEAIEDAIQQIYIDLPLQVLFVQFCPLLSLR
ncbi:zinc finger HIT domain-containing protein 2-like isoform X2 [Artemia franciscana]|uniref:zinc finger HIT domain-containing protein 2-like isoform X2 n=1 Tax=Artemia franciscana TaxID=6661 RepID=UPI0032DBB5F9